MWPNHLKTLLSNNSRHNNKDKGMNIPVPDILGKRMSTNDHSYLSSRIIFKRNKN